MQSNSSIIQNIIDLSKFDRSIFKKGYEEALNYIDKKLKLDMLSVQSGTSIGTFVIPQQWVIRDAWVKYNDKKLFNCKRNPLYLANGSVSFKGKLAKKDFVQHLFTDSEMIDGIPNVSVNNTWGFCITKKQYDKLKDGKYEVFIDTFYQDNIFKVGEHFIQGEIDEEIIFIANLDGRQVNDNLSGVAMLIDMAKKLKCKHSLRFIFCPKGFGSLAWYFNNKNGIDFVISVNAIGNDNCLMMQRSFKKDTLVDMAFHMALANNAVKQKEEYKKGEFIASFKGDEEVFNDPLIGIPAILLTRYPYKEHNTDKDTIELIKENRILETEEVIQKAINILEVNWVPVRRLVGQLDKNRFECNSFDGQMARKIDFLWYRINGEYSVLELALMNELDFDEVNKLLLKLKRYNLVYEK
jgi:aminopeptidase-like protein